jgi:hypothetical protein
VTAHPLARSVLILLGVVALAIGLALVIEGDTDESEEILFAAAVVATGAMNLVAGGLPSLMRHLPAVALTADVLLVGFVFYVFSQGSLG